MTVFSYRKKLPYRTDNFRLRGMKIQALPEIQKNYSGLTKTSTALSRFPYWFLLIRYIQLKENRFSRC
ncbi:Uncharacterised protein [Neisseria meningitidis]|nr:Uncharacterised protein [Neisseria meningitidis]